MIWSDNEIKFLQKYLEKTTAEIFEKFQDKFRQNSRSYRSIQEKVRRLRAAFDQEDDEESEQLKTLMELSMSGALPLAPSPEDKILNEKIRKLFIEDLIEYSKEVKLKKPLPPVQSNKSSLCILLSDVHVGQQNKWYNIDIFKERIASVADSVFLATKSASVDEIVLILAGDIVEGEDIYPTQASHISCPVIDQVALATQGIWDLVLSLRRIFDTPVRIVAVPGNHGRAGKEVNEKTNWDNVVYHCLKLIIANTSDNLISIECDFEEFQSFRVKDKKGVAYHYGVKHTGTPATREKVAGWMVSKKCDFLVSGHWHEWKIGAWLTGIIIGNGSMCGPSDLSERMALGTTPARQSYFLVTPGQPLWGFGFVEWKVPENNESEIPYYSKK